VFCALAVLAEERNPVECLDAFGATGWTGLHWLLLLTNLVSGLLTTECLEWHAPNVPFFFGENERAALLSMLRRESYPFPFHGVQW